MVQSRGPLKYLEVFETSSPMANANQNMGKSKQVEWGEIRLKKILRKSAEFLYVEYSNLQEA